MAFHASNVACNGGVSNSGSVGGNIATGVHQSATSGANNTSSTSTVSYVSNNGGVCAHTISNVASVGGCHRGTRPDTAGARVGGVSASTSSPPSPARHAPARSERRQTYRVSLVEKTPESRKAHRLLWASALKSAKASDGSHISFVNGKLYQHVVLRMTPTAACDIMSDDFFEVMPVSDPRSPLSSSDESDDNASDAGMSDNSDASRVLFSDSDDEGPQSPRSFSSSVCIDERGVTIASGAGSVAASNIHGGVIGGCHVVSRSAGRPGSVFVSTGNGSRQFVDSTVRQSRGRSAFVFDTVRNGAGSTAHVSVSGTGRVVIGCWDDITSKPPAHFTVGSRTCPECRRVVPCEQWGKIHVDSMCAACKRRKL